MLGWVDRRNPTGHISQRDWGEVLVGCQLVPPSMPSHPIRWCAHAQPHRGYEIRHREAVALGVPAFDAADAPHTRWTVTQVLGAARANARGVPCESRGKRWLPSTNPHRKTKWSIFRFRIYLARDLKSNLCQLTSKVIWSLCEGWWMT